MDLIVSVAFSLERSLFDDLLDTITRFKDSPSSNNVDDAIIDIRDMLAGQNVTEDFFDALQAQWSNIQPQHIKQLRAEHDEGGERDRSSHSRGEDEGERDRDRDRDHDRERERDSDRHERDHDHEHDHDHDHDRDRERSNGEHKSSERDQAGSGTGTGTGSQDDANDDRKELEDIPNSPMFTIFVANLNKEVEESDLREAFSSIGHIYSTVVVRDKVSRESKCYGFVHFDDEQARKTALDTMREVEIKGRRSKCFAADDKNKLFIGNISKHATEAQIKREVEKLGGPYTHIEIKLGFAFVTYVNFKRAERALIRLQGFNLEGKRLVVEPAKQDKKNVDHDMNLNHETTHTLYVKNIASEATRDQIENYFSRYGKVRDVRLKKNDSGSNMGFCHVEFEKGDDANRALQAAQDQDFLGRRLHIEFSRPVDRSGSRRGGMSRDGGGSGGVTLRDERGGGSRGMRGGGGSSGGGSVGGGGMGLPMGGFGYGGYPPMLAAAAVAAGGGGGGFGYGGGAGVRDPYADPRDQRRRRPSIDDSDRFDPRDARRGAGGGAGAGAGRDVVPLDNELDMYGAMGYAPQMAYDERTRRYVYVTPQALAGAYQAYPGAYGGRDGRDSRDREVSLRDPYATYRDLPMGGVPARGGGAGRDDDLRDSRRGSSGARVDSRGEKRYRDDDTGDRDRDRAKRYRDQGQFGR